MRALLIAALAGLVTVTALYGPDDRAVAKTAGESTILALAAGEDAVWAWVNSYELVRVDPWRMAITARTDTVPAALTAGIAVGEGGVWSAGSCGRLRCGYGVLMRFDPATGRRSRPLTPLGLNPRGIAVGHGSVWVLGARRVLRIDPGTRRMSGPPIAIGRRARGIAVGPGAVWVTVGARACHLVGIDPRTGTVSMRRPVACGSVARALAAAAGRGGRWVARVRDAVTGPYGERRGRAVLSRVDAAGRARGRSLQLGEALAWLPRVTAAAGAVWVANAPTGTITRVDPGRRTIEGRLRVPPRTSRIGVG